MSDPGYSIVSARYANAEHTAVIARTREAGDVAASQRDRPALWARIHRTCPAVAPYDPNAVVQPPPVVVEPEAVYRPPVDLHPEPPAEPAQPDLHPVAAPPAVEVAPAFYEAPVHAQPPSPTNLRMTPLQDILAAAEPEPIKVPPIRVPEAPPDWRRRAKAAVMQAVNDSNARLAGGRALYEQALMARNGKVEPLAGLKLAASINGLTVEQEIEQIIGAYDAGSRRSMYVHAVQQRAVQDIDKAGDGDAADAIARQAVKDIMGEDT